MSDITREEWETSADTHKLKRDLTGQLEAAQMRLVAAAGCSSDPKCSELAREIRKIQEFMKMLSPEKKHAERND